MLGFQSPLGVPSRPIGYANFTGINRARSRIALERKDEQPFFSIYNATCDWRGFIEREPILERWEINNTTHDIVTVKHVSTEDFVWAEKQAEQTNLNSSRGHVVESAFTPDAIPTMNLFRGRMYVMAPGETMHVYDSTTWSRSSISIKPGFGTAISNRMIVAGDPSKPTEVHISRVNDARTFANEEAPENNSITKAVFIDVQNLLNTADIITGLGAFEVNRLAIFTKDQVLVYQTDPDYTQWQIDSRANVRIGCISHRTICNAGSDLLYCSRHGVHALTRDVENGINITSQTLSYDIEPLYRQLVSGTSDPNTITACFDQDLGHYHVFFPRENGSQRLTLALRKGYEMARWTQGQGNETLCADSLGGRLVFGTKDGAYTSNRFIATGDFQIRPKMEMISPVLWLGDMNENKQSVAFLLQAVGDATVLVEVMDEDGDLIMGQSVVLKAQIDDDDRVAYNALEDTYRLYLQAKFRGLQVKISSEDDGDVQIYAFGIELQK